MAIQFDDGLSSVYNTVFPLMQARGLVGTAYINSSLVGTAGKMTEAQILELAAAGWDIGNHTDTHPDLRTLTVEQQETEFTTCQAYLDGLGLNAASKHICYPSGWYDANTLTAMANTGMLTGRVSSSGRICIDPPDYPIYEIPSPNPDTLTAGELNALEASLTGGVYVYHQHDVGTDPDFTVQEFTDWLDYLLSIKILCITISQLYSRL